MSDVKANGQHPDISAYIELENYFRKRLQRNHHMSIGQPFACLLESREVICRERIHGGRHP